MEFYPALYDFNCGVILTLYIHIYIFVFKHLPPWQWPHEWLKHVGGHYTIKQHSYNLSELVGVFNKFYTSN